MAWTNPPTWVTDQVVTAPDLNTYLTDNLVYLLNRPGTVIKRDNGSTYTTTSATFVAVDDTNLAITVAVKGSAVLVGFSGVTNSLQAEFDINVDGTRVGSAGEDGIVQGGFVSGSNTPVAITALVTGLSVGNHTFKLFWRSRNGSSISLMSGNGSGGADFIPVFWAAEVG